MMQRQQMLSILNNVEESRLAQALSAIGINCHPGGYRDQLGDEHGSDDDAIQSWNARQVTVERPTRPALYSKGMIYEAPKATKRDRPEVGPLGFDLGQPGEEDDGGMSDYLTQQAIF